MQSVAVDDLSVEGTPGALLQIVDDSTAVCQTREPGHTDGGSPADCELGTKTKVDTVNAALAFVAERRRRAEVFDDPMVWGSPDLALAGPSGWTTIPVAFSKGNGGFTATNNSVTDFPTWASYSGVKLL
jgi:hypothetical protein